MYLSWFALIVVAAVVYAIGRNAGRSEAQDELERLRATLEELDQDPDDD